MARWCLLRCLALRVPSSVKVGSVTLVLGVMHLFNLYVFNRIRRRALLPTMPPPLPPDGHLPIPTA